MKTTTKKKRPPVTAIEALAKFLETQANALSSKATLIQTKAMMARKIADNGASIDSVSEKLGWKPQKLFDLLKSADDMDLRTLSDIATALGCRIKAQATPTEATIWRSET